MRFAKAPSYTFVGHAIKTLKSFMQVEIIECYNLINPGVLCVDVQSKYFCFGMMFIIAIRLSIYFFILSPASYLG